MIFKLHYVIIISIPKFPLSFDIIDIHVRPGVNHLICRVFSDVMMYLSFFFFVLTCFLCFSVFVYDTCLYMLLIVFEELMRLHGSLILTFTFLCDLWQPFHTRSRLFTKVSFLNFHFK